jgi:stage V sporulation protein G
VEITEVRIKLMEDQQERLQAFCSITFDSCFVIRDLKIIEGSKGSFVAMPSRKLTDRCHTCHSKNHLRSLFCNHCGARLQEERATKADDGRAKLYADIAHPINSRCREMIQTRVLQAYDEELIKAKQPGYICSYDDYGEEGYEDLSDYIVIPMEARREPREIAATADTTLRLDIPATIPTNGGPHHNANPSWMRENFVAQRCATADSDDGFGLGIL